ncbi:hypothetical protein [Actinacidiphila glaucinigra]|uniref:hypothetical protein n=1 Tax=Actinacidiphila glaucinigra TaxID=235986 RepID=UPI002DDA3A2F|nr:hypothetical protein [Actinacidiphila glaucinigra]WSD60851.1 hypothetical protein OIE69_18970 [Actinacidiphila glaucinigra]
MNQVARRIGKSLALVLPVVLVLSGTLAVTRVPWATSASEAQVLTASHQKETATARSAPQEVLRRKLLGEVQQKNPGVALTHLQREMAERPSLAQYCGSIARSLGRAAVAKYGSVHRAQAWSRPVCDTAFATGVASVG